MIDVHCHLNFHSFEKDYDQVIKRALLKGVTKIINTGTQIDSSESAVMLSEKYNCLYAIIGIHPHHADKANISLNLSTSWIERLEELTKHPKVVGIGECGMDYFSYKSNGIVDKHIQQQVFEQQILLSHKTKLPLQIHNRQAGKDIIAILNEYQSYLLPIPGMFHCFAGNRDVLVRALELGFYIGFDGNLTYPGLAPGESTSLAEIVSYVPINRIVCETDSPFLTPEPHRGQRNEPQYVILVAKAIAKIKQIPYEQVVDQTTQNVYTIFSKLSNSSMTS